MADVIVGKRIQKLISLLGEEFSLIKGAENYVKKLSDRLLTIQAILDDAEANQLKNKSITDWLTKLKDATYAAEDVLDVWCSEAQGYQLEITSTDCTSLVSYAVSTCLEFIQIIHRHRIANKMNRILVIFDEIAGQASNFDLKSNSISNEVQIHGRNGDIDLLRLSYNRLPTTLKQCFAYCSIFPRDFRMEKTKLIYLWIANDYIPFQEAVELEETGGYIFNELLRLSFFYDAAEDSYGNIRTCKMHELMYDVACSVSSNECLTMEVDGGREKVVPNSIRHFSVVSDSPQLSTFHDPVFTCHRFLRTLFFFGSINFPRFKYSLTLRVLDLSYTGIEIFPSAICHLKHLRYLDLSGNNITYIPDSICRLSNLQMLDLSYNGGLETLPLTITNLEHLRYLNLSNVYILSLPDSIDSLTNLRRLDLSRNFAIQTLPSSIGNLENLRHVNLSRCPCIEQLPKSLGCLKNLQMLNLSENTQIEALPIDNMESLIYLNLHHCAGLVSLPESVCDKRNLQSLILSRCYALQTLPEGTRNLRSLRDLDIEECDGLTRMPVGMAQLTSLQTLNQFVVGDDSESGSIKELHGLNELKGKLEITQLANVKDVEDAKEADLKSKLHLTELTLSWLDYKRLDSVQEDIHMLEALLPPPNIRVFEIEGYQGEKDFPQGYLENLTALTSLEIRYSHGLSVPQGLHKITSLEKLKLYECGGIDRLPVMGIQGLHSSLLYLHIHWCQGIISLSEGLQYLTSLERLEIYDCHELELEMNDFQHLISLRTLALRGLPKLRALPEGIQQLPMLQKLKIKRCKNLRILPEWLQHLTALKYLSIEDCLNLRKLPEAIQHLTSVEDEDDGWQYISRLPSYSDM